MIILNHSDKNLLIPCFFHANSYLTKRKLYLCNVNSNLRPWQKDQRVDISLMSNFYYVNRIAQPTGEHEVHQAGCGYLPSEENRIYLGFFTNSGDAIREAKKYYSNVDGCFFCCPESHRR